MEKIRRVDEEGGQESGFVGRMFSFRELQFEINFN